MDVIVESDRDQRTLDWLISRVGEDAIDEACRQLSGRKPFVSNVAKVLSLTPPESLAQPTREEARERLAAIKASLQVRPCS